MGHLLTPSFQERVSFIPLKLHFLVVKRKSASMFPKFPQKRKTKRYSGFLGSAPRHNHRCYPTVESLSLLAMQACPQPPTSLVSHWRRKKTTLDRDLNPLCPSAHCSHLLSSLVSLENVEYTVHSSSGGVWRATTLRFHVILIPSTIPEIGFIPQLILLLNFSPLFQTLLVQI